MKSKNRKKDKYKKRIETHRKKERRKDKEKKDREEYK